jgi:hypothetical protein
MPRTKSPFALRMDEIQKLIDLDLKPLGFKKSGRNYNRQTEPGVVQVISFQMGAFEPPTGYVSPVPSWLKPDLYGKFCVNLGIYVEELVRSRGLKLKKFVAEYSCPIRKRLGPLVNPDGQEYWWPLDAPAEEIAEEIGSHLFSAGLDFLNRFASRSAIISDYIQYNDLDSSGSPRARLDVGIILATRGDMDEAAKLFREHLAKPRTNSAHVTYVKELASALGVKLEN